MPDYGYESYAIVILPDEGDPLIFGPDDSPSPLSSLCEDTLFQSVNTHTGDESRASEPTVDGTGPPGEEQNTSGSDSLAADQDSVALFAQQYLVADGETVLPKREVYTTYRLWATENEYDPVNKSWFSRKLGNHIEFDTRRVRMDGDLVRCYDGMALDVAGGDP